MNEKLKTRLEGERDHSMFLEELLAALYGPGWDKLIIYEAKKWRKRHLTSRSSRAAEACAKCICRPAIPGWKCIIPICEHYPPPV